MGSGGGPDEGGSRAQDFRLQEQRRATAQGMQTNQAQRNFARNIQAAQQLEERAAGIDYNLPPGASRVLEGVARASLTRQANILRGQSTTAEPVRDDAGDVVGVVSRGLFGGRVYSGRPGSSPIGTGMQSTQRDDVTPEVTPLVTPEVVPDDASAGVIMDASARGRGPGVTRRTRGKLLGGAADFETLLGPVRRV